MPDVPAPGAPGERLQPAGEPYAASCQEADAAPARGGADFWEFSTVEDVIRWCESVRSLGGARGLWGGSRPICI